MSLDSSAKTSFINGLISDMKSHPGGNFMEEERLRLFVTALCERVVNLVKNGEVTVTSLNVKTNIE